MDTITEASVALLRRDGRASFSDIARQLNTNRTNVAKRIGALIENGDIRIVAAVHPRLLGLNVLAHVTIRSEGDVGAMSEMVCEMNSSIFVSEVAGHNQLVAELHMANMNDLYNDVHYIRSIAGVLEVQVIIYERMLKSFFLGEEPQMLELALDSIDLHLIELLQLDGRLGYSEMGEQVGLSISGCRTRINRLIETGAMQIGLLRQRTEITNELVFGFGFIATSDQSELIELLEGQRGLEFIARTVGRFNLVGTITFNDLLGFNDFVTEVRKLDGVRIAEQWLHARIRKERYQNSLHLIRETIS
ncbi:AsnC family transcriptional regulator [Alpinimonas psychrophila]|uniref:DNA-binding Lrp family transcriptional regulator n=1 Tax=Alpinimonas psychrophila TaxID=748908 RepID=A0A7W3JUK7_9MICO|nr:DNA-binding Lrp family transcriptional regulator [Alpinimonas psychrophila]